MQKGVSVMALGGTKRVGAENCYIFGDGRTSFMADCGLGLVKDENGRIRTTYPPFSKYYHFLKGMDGIYISHGHLDHVGGLLKLYPLLRENARTLPPVYAGDFAYSIAMNQFLWDFGSEIEEEILDECFFRHEVISGEEMEIARPGYTVRAIATPHSIPDAYGFGIEIGGKRIYYAGDFRLSSFDREEVNRFKQRIEEIGRKGVDAAFIECTNVFEDNTDESEEEVTRELERITQETNGRIIFATFSSHVDRVERMIEIAKKYNRPVYVSGTSLQFTLTAKKVNGWKSLVNEFLLEPDAVVCSTGVQAESGSVLSKSVKGEARFQLRYTDTVIVSADPIPENGIEEAVCEMVKRLVRYVKTVYVNKDVPDYFPSEAIRAPIHVSGHEKRQGLEWMIQSLDPQVVVPIHGDIERRKALGVIADSFGKKSLLLEEGQVVLL